MVQNKGIIMSMFGNLKYVNAYFSNEAHTEITTYWEDDDNLETNLHEIVISTADEVSLNELLTYTTHDEINENTWSYIHDSQEAFKEKVIEIAKDRGWLVNMNDGGTSDFNKILVDLIFDDYDEKIHKEKLFYVKINLFEKDFVKEGKDKDSKRRLRRAATPLEAFRVAIEIYDTMKGPSSSDAPD